MSDETSWKSGEPTNARPVLARYDRHSRGHWRAIVAFVGSEGKWMALDHDERITYLQPGCVFGWREIPE